MVWRMGFVVLDPAIHILMSLPVLDSVPAMRMMWFTVLDPVICRCVASYSTWLSSHDENGGQSSLQNDGRSASACTSALFIVKLLPLNCLLI